MVTNPRAVAQVLLGREDLVQQIHHTVHQPERIDHEEIAPLPDFCVCGRCRELPEMLSVSDNYFGWYVRWNYYWWSLHIAGWYYWPWAPSCAAVLRDDTLHHSNGSPCVLRAALNRTAEHVFNFDAQHQPNNYRRTAYQQFVYYAYGWLGAKERRALPACACWAIRDAYPSPNGVYRGFRFARWLSPSLQTHTFAIINYLPSIYRNCCNYIPNSINDELHCLLYFFLSQPHVLVVFISILFTMLNCIVMIFLFCNTYLVSFTIHILSYLISFV